MGFSELLSQSDLGLRFYLEIQGIGLRLFDGPIPTAPDGSAWDHTTSKGVTVENKPHLLDVSEGVEDIGPWISRATSETQPSGITLTVKDDRAGTLLDLFAREKSDGAVAKLTESFGYATGSGPSVMTVDSTTGFTGGLIYFGTETIRYTGTTATTFTGLTRDLFSVGDGDQQYTHNSDIAEGTGRIVSDYVRDWAGRYIRLFAFQTASDGRALDDGPGGDQCAEIFRGVIRAVKPRSDWHRWDIECDSIDSILNTEVGADPIPAALVRLPGDADANAAGVFDLWGGSGPVPYFLTADGKYIDLTITRYEVSAGNDLILDSVTIRTEIVPDYDVLTKEQLGSRIIYATNTDITAEGWTGGGQLAFDFADDGSWIMEFDHDETASEYSLASINWDAPGSVGKLIGFSGTSAFNGGSGVTSVGANERELAIYVSATSETGGTIPFYYVHTAGAVTATPPTPGYARLGDEILHYEDIQPIAPSSPWSGTLNGLYELTGVTRGVCGSQAQEHKIARGDKKSAVESSTALVFGAGWDGVSFIEAILQLCHSTGEDGHHGSYDTLPARFAVPLNPNHFDLPAWESVTAGLFATQSQIALFASQGFNLRDRISQWLRPHGLFVLPRLVDGEYLISIGRMSAPLESEAPTAIGAGALDAADPAVHVLGHTRVINEVVIKPIWDAGREQTTDDQVRIVMGGPRHTRASVTWELVGYDWSLGQAIGMGSSWARRLFARYGRAYNLLQLHADRGAMLIEPGDTVTVTIPGIPNPEGGRGLTDRVATALRVRRLWHHPAGGSEAVGAEVTIIVEPIARSSSYAPAARVDSYSTASGRPVVTLHTNEYTAPGQGTDADHFEAGDVVLIYSEGDWSTVDQRTIEAIDGDEVELDSNLSNSAPVSSTDTVMVSAAYTAASGEQSKHVYIASNAQPPAVGSDVAFRYV